MTDNNAADSGNAAGESTTGTEAKAPPPPSVWPALRATDAHGLIRFLTEALGFEATVVYADGDTVHHAELAWPPGGGVMLGSVRADAPHPATRPGTLTAYAVTADPDALHARAVAHGAKVVQDLYDTDYGSREFAVEDPEGNRWTFGTYPGAPR
jgi:uncharacterized glyoxalase superfamily protein PhnB